MSMAALARSNSQDTAAARALVARSGNQAAKPAAGQHPAATVLAREDVLLLPLAQVLVLRDTLRNGPETLADRLTHYSFAPETLREALASLPTLAELEQARDEALRAVDAPADPRVNRVLVSLLIDAFPKSITENALGYIETLIHDVTALGLSPARVAWSLRSVRQSSKFLPSVSEVVEACSRGIGRSVVSTTYDKALHVRAALEATLAAQEGGA